MLDRYGVRVIGVQPDAIRRGEDRQAFKDTMDKIGLEMPASDIAHTVDEALRIADRLSYPVVVRPAYTMGGTGGGLVSTEEELRGLFEKHGIAPIEALGRKLDPNLHQRSEIARSVARALPGSGDRQGPHQADRLRAQDQRDPQPHRKPAGQ